MPLGRFILYSVEQNMSLTAGPPSSSLAVEPYCMYITGLRHFRAVQYSARLTTASIAAAAFSNPTVYHVSEELSTGM